MREREGQFRCQDSVAIRKPCHLFAHLVRSQCGGDCVVVFKVGRGKKLVAGGDGGFFKKKLNSFLVCVCVCFSLSKTFQIARLGRFSPLEREQCGVVRPCKVQPLLIRTGVECW